MAAPGKGGNPTLLDRCALGFLSGLSGLLLGSLIWGAVALTFAQIPINWTPSFGWVLAFAAAMAVLGFLLLENLVVNLVTGLIRWVARLTGPF